MKKVLFCALVALSVDMSAMESYVGASGDMPYSGNVSYNDLEDRGDTPLHQAAYKGDVNNIYKFLRSHDVNVRNNFGETPLHYAAENGQVDAVMALLGAGADVNAIDQYGDTPLHMAALEGHDAVVRALVDAGARVDKENFEGETPFGFAQLSGNSENVWPALMPAGALKYSPTRFQE